MRAIYPLARGRTVARGAARATRRALGRARRGHPVGVVVLTRGEAAFVDACLASVRSQTHAPVAVSVAPWADAAAAVTSSPGRFVMVVDADDTLPEDAVERLVSSLASSGSAVALGRRTGAQAWPVAWGTRTGTVDADDCPEALADPSVLGCLVRADAWQPEAHEPLDLALARALVTGPFDLVGADVYDLGGRDLSLPVTEQRRYDPAVVAERVALLDSVGALLTGSLLTAWAVAVVEQVLPRLCVDAVGGGAAYLEPVAGLARRLLDGLDPTRVALAARLGAWTAAHGHWDDLALVQGFLADHAPGLPVVDGVLPPPPGLGVEPPVEVRRVEEVDRRLHVRLGPAWPDGRGRFVADGSAYRDHSPGEPVAVSLLTDGAGRQSLRPVPRPEPGGESAFSVALPEPTTGGRWVLEVEVGGATARVEVGPAPRSQADAVVEPVGLDGHRLRVRVVEGEVTGVRLRGPLAETAVAPVRDGVAELVLECETFGTVAPLPAGRYSVEAPVRVAWDDATRRRAPELAGERLRAEPAEHAGRAVVHVRAPLAPAERGPVAQQRLQETAYAAPPRAALRDTVLFETFHGRATGDNPGAVCAELLRRDTGLDVAWVVDDPSVVVPEGTRAVVRRSEEWYAVLAGARGYVANAAAPRFFRKRDDQLHLQTWHGTPLKRIGEDRGPGGLDTWRHRRVVAGQAARWDAMVSPSGYCSDILRSAFGYTGPMLEVGYPRNDLLLAPDRDQRAAQVRRDLGVEDGQRVVLYAPTWREYLGRRDPKPLYLDPVGLTTLLPDTVVLVRGHYNATRQPDVFGDERRVVDVTRYPDIAPLFLAAHALVTDYSSVMFDYVLLDRPVVLLVPDLEQYREVERGFYFDVEAEPPGPLVATTDEVADSLTGPDRYAAHRAAYRDRFCPHDDGSASARVVDELLRLW